MDLYQSFYSKVIDEKTINIKFGDLIVFYINFIV